MSKSVQLPTCLPVYLPTCLPAYLPTCLPAYQSTCLLVYLPTCRPVYLPTCRPVYLPTCPPAYQSTCPPAHQPTCPVLKLYSIPTRITIYYSCPPIYFHYIRNYITIIPTPFYFREGNSAILPSGGSYGIFFSPWNLFCFYIGNVE